MNGLQLIEECKKLKDAKKLSPFEGQTVEAIEDSYLAYGSMSSAEWKFLEELIQNYK